MSKALPGHETVQGMAPGPVLNGLVAQAIGSESLWGEPEFSTKDSDAAKLFSWLHTSNINYNIHDATHESSPGVRNVLVELSWTERVNKQPKRFRQVCGIGQIFAEAMSKAVVLAWLRRSK